MHFAGPIKNVLGPNAELPAANSFHSTTNDKHATTSAAHGRTAHVFATSMMTTTQGTGDTPSSESDWLPGSGGVSLSRLTASSVSRIRHGAGVDSTVDPAEANTP